MENSMARSANTTHTHSTMIHLELLFHAKHYKIYQVIHWEQTHTRFCHVMEPPGLTVPAFQQHVNNNTSYGDRNIKPRGKLDFLFHAAIVYEEVMATI